MKNLFKATLLACASFFIASCTNDPSTEGVPQTPEKTVSLTIEAGSDDESRTTIVQGEDGKYQMLWNAAETEQNLAVVELLDGDTNPVLKGDNKVRKGTCKEVNEGSTKAVFDVPLLADDSFGHESYYYITCYPYEALEKFAPAEKKVYATLPATQSPKADDNNPALATVDPAATMLFSEYEAESEGQRPYWLSLSYKHMSAYVKMSFTGITLNAYEKIDHIIFTANDEDAHLTGAFSYDYENRTVAAESGADNSVTLNVSELNFKGDDETYVVPDFTVYFSTLPAKLSDFTVTVVANNKRRYTKHVTITITEEKDYLTFETGKTRAVKITNSGFETEKQKVFKKVEPGKVTSGNNYIIISQATTGADTNPYVLKNNGAASGLSAVNLEDAGFTSKDEITLLNADASDYTWTFTGTTDAFTILSTTSNTYLNASKASSSSVYDDYVPLVLGNDSQTWKLDIYSSADIYRMTIQSNTYAGDYIATNRAILGNGTYYTTHYYGWTQIFMYEETDDDSDVNDSDKDKEDVYYKRVTTFEADKEYVITTEFDGVLYTMDNPNGQYSGVKLEPVQLFNGAGFTKVNDNVIMRKESDNYLYVPKASGSTYAFKSKLNDSYLRYTGNFTTSTASGYTQFTVTKSSNTTFTVSTVYQNNTYYMKVYRPTQYSAIEWGCTAGTSNITFWEQTDDPDAGEEPEEPEEDATEYKKITTWNLPESTPVIITVTKGDNTYVLYNVPDGVVSNGEPDVTAKTLSDAKFETTDTGISGPVSKFTWDIILNGSAYRFNSTSRTGEYAALMYNGTKLTYTNGAYGTSFTLYKANGKGDYYLYNGTKYLSVDDSGNLVAGNSGDATVNLYGLSEAVEAQEQKEAAEYNGEYKKITTNALPVEVTKAPTPVIITVTKNDNTYVLYNVPNGTVSNGAPYVTTMLLNDVFTMTDTGISGPVSKFAWDATSASYNNDYKPPYRFDSKSRPDNTSWMLMYYSPRVTYTNTTGTSLTPKKVSDEGDYYLYNTSNVYLSVDGSGNLVTTNSESDAAKVNFYGLPEAVEQQEQKEAEDNKEDTTSTYVKVDAFKDGKEYLLVGAKNGVDYIMQNTSQVTLSNAGLDKAGNTITGDGSGYEFKTTEYASGFWLTTPSGSYLSANPNATTSFMGTYFNYNATLGLTYTYNSLGYYLYFGMYMYGSRDNNTNNLSAKVDIYEKQEKKKDPTFEVVSDMQEGDVVILTSGNYCVGNNNSYNTISGTPSVDNYQNMTFTVKKEGSSYYFQSTATQKWLTKGSNGYIDFADNSASAYWTFAGNKLSYQGNSNGYLYLAMFNNYWSAAGATGSAATLTVYKVVE